MEEYGNGAVWSASVLSWLPNQTSLGQAEGSPGGGINAPRLLGARAVGHAHPRHYSKL
jgi:hypothetical protein